MVRATPDAAMALNDQICDLLTFSCLDAGKVEIADAPTRLGDVIRTAVAQHRDAAAAKGLDLEVDIAPQAGPEAPAGADRLRQALPRLLDDAVKFTASGGGQRQRRSRAPAPAVLSGGERRYFLAFGSVTAARSVRCGSVVAAGFQLRPVA